MGLLVDITKCNHCQSQANGHHGYCPECGAEDVIQTQEEIDFDELSKEAGFDTSILPIGASVEIEFWHCLACDTEFAGGADECPECNSPDVHYWYRQSFNVVD